MALKVLSREDVGLSEIPFCLEKIKETIWESDFGKSLGSDGFNMSFFKLFQNTIKEELIAFLN